MEREGDRGNERVRERELGSKQRPKEQSERERGNER